MLRSFLMLLPALLFAAGNLSPVTVLPPDGSASTGAALVTGRPAPGGSSFRVDIGTVDTIGGTSYDWQANGPGWRKLVYSPGYGLHATWMYSVEMSGTTFPDRNMRYNYYDEGSGYGWNWIDPDYMQSGVNTFAQRAGYGSLDADPTSGVAVISCHYQGTGGVTPMVAMEAAPGTGIFDYANGEPVLGVTQWPPISVGQNGTINIFPITAAYGLSYSHIAAGNWPTFSTPVTGISPSPGFPTQGIAASKGSGKVCLVWEISTDDPQDAYMKTSTDNGATWSNPQSLQPPDAYGGDTVTAFHITSLFPFYDNNDRLNIVANLSPEVNDTVYIIPSQIWHYCPNNTPPWNRIHVAGCNPYNLLAAVGYNATYACRPSIGQDDDGDLFVAWEQFDSANVEPSTSRLRADVWAAGSIDGGINWATPRKLTTAGTASCRFPCISDMAGPGDSMAVTYEVDQCAGFFVQSEGSATYNPIIVQKVPIDSLIQHGPYSGHVIRPNGGEVLFGGDTFHIKWSVTPQTFDHGVLSLSTDGGSTFPTVLGASIPPAETTYLWDSVPYLNYSHCRVKFAAVDSLGDTLFSDMSNGNFTIDSVYTDVAENRLVLGTDVCLFKPAPNPFTRTTVVRLTLPREMPVAADVYNTAGQKVRSLASGIRCAGVHSLIWDGTDAGGRNVQAGVYYLRMTAESGTVTQAIVLSR